MRGHGFYNPRRSWISLFLIGCLGRLIFRVSFMTLNIWRSVSVRYLRLYILYYVLNLGQYRCNTVVCILTCSTTTLSSIVLPCQSAQSPSERPRDTFFNV
ncbi:uncharacterized protein BT62DRAFT_211882 [Guyanagaster necrorhizus]|uniref:Uncharacterized protein n=1 Tax=Guyanagaster necrorhizus TaxID=856835 RepID=A0A9P7VR94_9AGAR|nr:uncharacterized protein BT62DRAFT_211882 [Guyanagaster necrorhizus MCA 3950]KAG7445137.1 hypothetical protein BT62DRAFT_211882 [Guyanagaster necrorhizus MCA 3950]